MDVEAIKDRIEKSIVSYRNVSSGEEGLDASSRVVYKKNGNVKTYYKYNDIGKVVFKILVNLHGSVYSFSSFKYNKNGDCILRIDNTYGTESTEEVKTKKTKNGVRKTTTRTWEGEFNGMEVEEYDNNNNLLYHKLVDDDHSILFESWYEYDENNNRIYERYISNQEPENSKKEWWEYDDSGKLVYHALKKDGYGDFRHFEDILEDRAEINVLIDIR